MRPTLTGCGVAAFAFVRGVGYPISVARSGTCLTLPFSFVGEIPVAAVCDVCAKGPGFGHNVPWSKKRTKRRWNPNIQRVRAVVAGTPKRLNVCTSCIKAGKVSR
jgi:large subunit ribosomal protein L28